jgi:hypothetical protein
MGLAGGFAGALAVFGLFSSMVPEREFWKQVRSFFAGCGTVMRDLENNPIGTPAGAAIVKATHQQWQGIFKQLQLWSSAIDYKRLPRDDRQKIQALIESIEHVALRLGCAEHAQRKPVATTFETLREPFHQLYNACADSFSLIANSLAELKPVPDLPDTEHLIREIESKGDTILQSPACDNVSHAEVAHALSVRAHFQSLGDAIQDCRDRANALDWKRWNRNYF